MKAEQGLPDELGHELGHVPLRLYAVQQLCKASLSLG